MYTRTQTKTIYIGGVPVGGGHPITIQSMATTDTRDVPATISQIEALAGAGCEIIRVAIPDMAAAKALRYIKNDSPIPVVADIHFDYRLALAAIENGADKLRINPGNIGNDHHIRQVAEAASKAGIPIRVGANSGSLEKHLLKKYGGITSEALCESILNHIAILEAHSFYDMALSIKSSDVPLTIEAHHLICEKVNYPLHIGITEAGTARQGIIKSAAGIGALLAMGIGDTLRVSLTGDPLEEVRVAKVILQSMGLRRFGPQIISCPTCGRCKADLEKLAHKVEDYCESITAPITIAVMGCEVNGPGEARDADFGIACAGRPGTGSDGIIFQKGQVIKKVPETHLVEALLELLENFAC